MDILEYLRSRGIEPKQKTADEYCSPCPVCGGTDRFQTWPQKDRWYCRGCDCSDTLVGLLMRVERLKFQEACALIGKPLEPMQKRSRASKAYSPPKRYEDSLPVAAVDGGEPWKQRAAPQFVDCSHRNLLKSKDVLDWLQSDRRLNLETIKRFRLGWNQDTVFHLPSDWGLSGDKKICLPRGLVIPYIRGGEIFKIKIRTRKEADTLPACRGTERPSQPYYEVRGGSREFMICGDNNLNFVLVESELDAIFLWQEVGDHVTAVAIGGANKNIDRETYILLRNAARVFVALDSDDTGTAASEKFLNLLTNTQAFPIPPVYGKDPTEAVACHGVNIRRQVLRVLGIPVAAATSAGVNDDSANDISSAGLEARALTDDEALIFQAVELESQASAAGMIEVAYQLDRALGTFCQTGEIAVDRGFAHSVLRSAIDRATAALKFQKMDSSPEVAA